MERKTSVRRGNIVSHTYLEAAPAGCYLGNGRFGGVFSGLGLNLSPAMQAGHPEVGQSQYTHMGHWGRFRFLSEAMQKETAADYILPLCKLYWENEPTLVHQYYQEQDFYDGVLRTSFTQENGQSVHLTSWFDMVDKDLAGIEVEVSEGVFALRASAITEFIPYAFLYKKETTQQVTVTHRGETWCVSIGCEDTISHTRSSVYFTCSAPVELCEDGLRFLFAKGKNTLHISYGRSAPPSACADSLSRTMDAWHVLWEDSGWFDFPDAAMQQVWVRSMAYLLSSYGDLGQDGRGPIQPTNGLTGNMFPFHFVQDLEYIAPALLMTGHGEIVQRWVEKFAGEIPAMRQYAQALWPDARGIYPPWELPYGSMEGYHTPSVPVVYCYEPHNVGYLCRLAKEAADFIGDSAWTARFAHPLVRECAEFYHAFCKKHTDGHWHMAWLPSIGQDEAGGRNEKDYLCSMYSAKYCFEAAVAYELDAGGAFAQILKDGLAFESLLSEEGICHTCPGADDFGKQKHPVQLDGLSYFPVEPAPLPPELAAYDRRYILTEGATLPFFHGWTLCQFLLAGSNTQNAAGWKEDWAQMRPSRYTDSRWIQLYETSGQAEKSFYMTNHGMLAQSLIRNYVNDYWGVLDLAACPVCDGVVRFAAIQTRLGVTVSGYAEDGTVHGTLQADRDCTVTLRGTNDKTLPLKQGDVFPLSQIARVNSFPLSKKHHC